MTDQPSSGDPEALVQHAIGYEFRDADLLRLGLSHRSHAAESGTGESYERLEFLGDAVLQLTVTEYLYDSYPDLAEGEMAKVRAAVVDAPTLGELGRRFHVGPALVLGHGEEITGGREKDSIIADAMEAIIGALYIDAGHRGATAVILRHWTRLVDRRATAPGERDYKTRLQERLAADGRRPRYAVHESGPEHRKEFSAEVWDSEVLLGRGTGSSKKRAEQDAARDASGRLENA